MVQFLKIFIYFIFLSVIIMSEPSRKASNECFLSFFWVGGEVEDNFASFTCAPQNFPGWVLYRGHFEVGLIAVFAEEGLKKGVGLINGGFWVGLQSRGREYCDWSEHKKKNTIAFSKSTSQRIYPKQHTPRIG